MRRILVAFLVFSIFPFITYSAPTDLKVIPPTGFRSDHRYIEVPKGANDQQLTELIRDEVIYLIGRDEQPTPYKDAITIYQNWMEEKQDLNNLWKKEMLDLSTQLRDQVAEVSNLRQARITSENELEVMKTQRDAMRQTLRNDSLSLQRYEGEKDFLKRNLENQLEDISYMVVVLGKRQLGVDENLSDVLEIIGDKMIVDAIKEVNGTRIYAETTVKNYQLIRDVVKSVESGHAQVLDSYTNDFAKKQAGFDTRYLVQAIEVSPFKSKESKQKSSRRVTVEPTINIITMENLNSIWSDNSLNDSRYDNIKDLIERFLDQAKKQNQEVSDEIAIVYSNYQTRLREIESKISGTKTYIRNHRDELHNYQSAYNRSKQKFDNYDRIILNPAIEQLKNIERQYRRYYNLRVFLADKTEKGWIEREQSPKNAYCDFASSTVGKLREIKEGEYENTVIAVDFQLDSYTESLVTYSPRVRAFTILYLASVELTEDISYLASVGYQMELNPKTTPTVSSISRRTSNKIQGPASGMEFAYIPGGSFIMGSPSNESGRQSDEGQQHRVTISSFYMMTTEVTQAQWKAVMGSNPSHFKGDNLPVEKVSWNDCQEFIRKLNQMDPGKGYRLPAEAEWEYACRAGTNTRFYSGKGESDLARVGWYSRNSGSKTHPVGNKEPNAWGLYDMHGNVWEWCQDWYHGNYNGAPTDGSAWVSGGGTSRVLRGGSWYDGLKYCRSANRYWVEPDYRSDDNGFRLVRSP